MLLRNGILLLSLVTTSILNALTLDEALQNAISINPDIKEKTKRYNEIYYDVEIAKAGYLPKMDLVVTSRLTDSRVAPFSDRLYNGQLTLTQNLFNGFGDVNKHNLEFAKYQSAFYTTKEFTNTFSLEVIRSYMNLLRDKELLAIQRSSVDNHENILTKITKKYNVGLGNKLELSLSQTSLYLAKINYHEQKNAVYQSTINLEKYLDQKVNVDTLSYPDDKIKIPATVEEALEIAFKSHPSMQISTLNKQMTDYEVSYTKKDLYPSLDIKGTYSNGEKIVTFDGQNEYYKLGLMLTYNLYHGGADQNAKKKILEKVAQKDALMDKTKRDIIHKVKSQYDNHRMISEKMELFEGYVKSKEVTLETYYAHFLIGKANLRDILDTTESLYIAKKMLLEGRFALLAAKYSILEAMGLLPSIEYSEYRYEPNKANPFSLLLENDKHEKLDLKKYSEMDIENVQPVKTNNIKSLCYVVEATTLNIRETNSVQSNILGSYIKGDVICEKESEGHWVRTEDGWVSKQYLTDKRE